jgi:hypothetical protein
MPAKKINSLDYQPLSKSAKKGETNSDDQFAFSILNKSNKEEEDLPPQSLVNSATGIKNQSLSESTFDTDKTVWAGNLIPNEADNPKANSSPAQEPDRTKEEKQHKQEKKAKKDRDLLDSDHWLVRNGHGLTYLGLYLFSILVLFRPYEIVSSLSFLTTTAFYFAAATLVFYVPSQLTTEGTLTMFSTEVKCILALAFLALLTMPIGKGAAASWTVFNEVFIKIVLIFVVMVNVVRTKRRLLGLIWLSLAIGIFLGYTAVDLSYRGELKSEGYRVAVEVGGLFGNPNDMALHFVMMTPIAVALGIASRSKITQISYFLMAGLFVLANMLTYSRGGFLGLVISTGILVWKIGRTNRLNVIIGSILTGGLFVLLAPGNYGLRLLSIFIPGLDPVGSSDERKELLFRSIFVTARNPWGIGMGNSPVMNDNNLQWHNTFMQVASELTVLGLLVYLIFLISPFRKLSAIERMQFTKGELDWFYYLSIGLQASIVGHLVSSFFVSVAYNWFIYYLIAYAVAFRRIYQIEKGIGEIESKSLSNMGKNFFGNQTA